MEEGEGREDSLAGSPLCRCRCRCLLCTAAESYARHFPDEFPGARHADLTGGRALPQLRPVLFALRESLWQPKILRLSEISLQIFSYFLEVYDRDTQVTISHPRSQRSPP